MAVRKPKRSVTKGKGAAPTRRAAVPVPAASKRTASARPEIRIFVSYSHKDAGAQQQLRTHLATLERDGVGIWYDGDLKAGDALDPGISRAMREAQVFVALLSPDYLASRYCWDVEYKRAMNRRARGTMRVIAVVVRHCDWRSTRAANFKLLPADGKPVTEWRNSDAAYLDVTKGIRGVVGALRKEAASPTKGIAKPARSGAKGSKAAGQPRRAKAGKATAAPGSGRRTRKTPNPR